MTPRPASAGAAFFLAFFLALTATGSALGSASTIAVLSSSGAVCGISASKSPQSVLCFPRTGAARPLAPNISFSSVSGGRNFFCGLAPSGTGTGTGSVLLCWDGLSYSFRRVYSGSEVLSGVSVGEDHVCALAVGTGTARCWRGGGVFPNFGPSGLRSVTSGRSFSCGISSNTSQVLCWGPNPIGAQLQLAFANKSMESLVAGMSHACGVTVSGVVLCKGSNDSGQVDVPSGPPFEYSSLALEANRSCAVRRNGSVICWGGGNAAPPSSPAGATQFEFIVSGSNFTCGLVTLNFTVLCWGSDNSLFNPALVNSTTKIIPGPCGEVSCGNCTIYPSSQTFCAGSGWICQPCVAGFAPAPPPPAISPSPLPPPRQESRSRLNRGLLAFAIVGSVGAFSGICSIIYCLWTGVCRQKKVHNSVQPTITGAAGGSSTSGVGSLPATSAATPFGSRSSTIRRQSSRALTMMRRQRSGTSSKHGDRAEELTLAELAAATNGFAQENKIGAGSFGTVYRGKLADGREVAIKRGDTGPKTKKFQEKESAFQSELAFLSRLHHKHLVGLVGFCEENDERLLVYEYMKNGALYDHLHGKNNGGNGETNVLNSWKMRIKIALDASRGIEYLHNYAVPPIIHRDIKSSNILLDANWTARVSDFGLSLMGPESENGHLSMKAAGTVGYMDPEYYGLHHLTAKSDVYGLGVVLLELLTGRRAIFREEGVPTPVSVVDYAPPKIAAGELAEVLDPRVGPPALNTAEAVELVAYTAVHCVKLEGKDRPTMSDIVVNLENALALCDDSHGSISSGNISLASD